MKKILLTTAAVAAISTSAFASDMENQFFVGAAVDGVYTSKFKTDGAKIKSKIGAGLDISAGYYVMDNVRVELAYNRPFVTGMKGSKTLATAPTAPAAGAAAGAAVNTAKSFKHKPTINALFAKVSGDVVDLGMGKIFLTGGLGWAQVKNSVTVTTTTVTPTAGAAGAAGTLVTTTPATTQKQKAKNNLAFIVGAGAAFDVADGVHLDVAYSYRVYGKAKASAAQVNANKFDSHNLSAGVRFDI